MHSSFIQTILSCVFSNFHKHYNFPPIFSSLYVSSRWFKILNESFPYLESSQITISQSFVNRFSKINIHTCVLSWHIVKMTFNNQWLQQFFMLCNEINHNKQTYNLILPTQCHLETSEVLKSAFSSLTALKYFVIFLWFLLLWFWYPVICKHSTRSKMVFTAKKILRKTQ